MPQEAGRAQYIIVLGLWSVYMPWAAQEWGWLYIQIADGQDIRLLAGSFCMCICLLVFWVYRYIYLPKLRLHQLLGTCQCLDGDSVTKAITYLFTMLVGSLDLLGFWFTLMIVCLLLVLLGVTKAEDVLCILCVYCVLYIASQCYYCVAWLPCYFSLSVPVWNETIKPNDCVSYGLLLGKPLASTVKYAGETRAVTAPSWKTAIWSFGTI